jgi:hypothetical protein
MRIAVTFCAQTKRERCDNESGDSLFRWSEAESLPHFIEPEAQGLFQFAKVSGSILRLTRAPRLNQNRAPITQR